MTDERGPEGAPAPDAEPAAAAPAPDAEPAAPPPLAPYVTGAASPPPPVAPPAIAWTPAPAYTVPATGQRTTLAALAGVLLLIGGILGGLAGLAVAIIGGSFAATLGDLVEIPGLTGDDSGAVFSGVIAFVGVLIFIYSLVYVFAGIGVLRNRVWGRIMGLTVGILSGVIWLGTVATPAQPDVQQSIVGSLLALGVHVYIVVALLLFWRSRPATA